MLVVHLIATSFLTGLIWFVQIVHYPMFRRLGVENSGLAAKEHQKNTTKIVGPAMLLELTTALLLLFKVKSRLALANLLLLSVTWFSTVLIQVPLHRRLSRKFGPETIERLVRTNWLRTATWSIRTILLTIADLKRV